MEKISLTKSPFMCLSHLDKIKWKELVWLPPYDVATFDLCLTCHQSGDGQGFFYPVKLFHWVQFEFQDLNAKFGSFYDIMRCYFSVCVFNRYII